MDIAAEILDEAYDRLHTSGPEWGGNLANHGPMAAEALARRGRADVIPGWIDAYVGRLDESPAARAELAHGLAYWAARSRGVPGVSDPAGTLAPRAALDAVPHLTEQEGPIRLRITRLAGLNGWTGSVKALRPAAGPDEVPERLAEVITAATLRYLPYGYDSPVLLVHTATAPNAVLHTLPALPRELWLPSLTAAWAASAAITAMYAPATAQPRSELPTAPEAGDPVAEVIDRACAHGDERRRRPLHPPARPGRLNNQKARAPIGPTRHAVQGTVAGHCGAVARPRRRGDPGGFPGCGRLGVTAGWRGAS